MCSSDLFSNPFLAAYEWAQAHGINPVRATAPAVDGRSEDDKPRGEWGES